MLWPECHQPVLSLEGRHRYRCQTCRRLKSHFLNCKGCDNLFLAMDSDALTTRAMFSLSSWEPIRNKLSFYCFLSFFTCFNVNSDYQKYGCRWDTCILWMSWFNIYSWYFSDISQKRSDKSSLLCSSALPYTNIWLWFTFSNTQHYKINNESMHYKVACCYQFDICMGWYLWNQYNVSFYNQC